MSPTVDRTRFRALSLALSVLVVAALFVPASPAGARKRPGKRCAALCKEPIARCRAAVAVETACAMTTGGGPRRACRRAQRREQRTCRTRFLRACKADETADRCVADDTVGSEPTAWENLLARVESSGPPSLETALQAFSLLIAPLPGVTLPPGALAGTAAAFGHDTGEVGGCAAVRWVRAYWDQLTPEQQQAVDAALADTSSVVVARDATPSADAAEADEIARFQQVAAEAATAIAAKLGQPLTVPIKVVFADPSKSTAAASLQPENADGGTTGTLALCRMFIPARTRANPDPIAVRGIVTHEVFHCFHAQIAGFERYKNLAAPQWLDEGGPNWVAADIVGLFTSIDSSWTLWFEQPEAQLSSRAYSGMGIFAEAAWLGANPWALFPAMFKESTHDDVFEILSTGIEDRLRRSWAASVLRVTSRSAEWDVKGNGVPPYADFPEFVTVPEGGVELVDVKAFAATNYRVTGAAKNVLVDVTGGHVRIGDALGRDIEAPPGTLLCTASPCTCPDGSPPKGTVLDVLPPFDVAVTGWTTGATGNITGLTVDDGCKRDPNDATGFCQKLQPLKTLGPALGDTILNGEPAALRAAWLPWQQTLLDAKPVPADIAATWARVLEVYPGLTTQFYTAIDYDLVDALVCGQEESAGECAAEIILSENYADAVSGYVGDLRAADAYLRAKCNVQLQIDFDIDI